MSIELNNGSTEEELAEIWRATTKGVLPGAKSNFFECGGHSLALLRLLVQVQRTFGVKISVGEFYSEPTFGSLCTLVMREVSSGPPSEQDEEGVI